MTKEKRRGAAATVSAPCYSLVPSDTRILAQMALGGILCALMMFGVPFLMALAKQAGWY